MSKSATIAALRSLIPVSMARSGRSREIPTGIPALDAAMGGGLLRGELTELVSAEASNAGELVFAALLLSTRSRRMRIALIDPNDGFAPGNYRSDDLRHLVWVRAKSLTEGLHCADILVRDGNYAAIVVDLRGSDLRALRRQSLGTWHRLRLAAERGVTAVMVQSPMGIVATARWRFVLKGTGTLRDLRLSRAERWSALHFEVERGHSNVREELIA